MQIIKMSKENLKNNYQTRSSVARKKKVLCKSSLLMDTISNKFAVFKSIKNY